MLSDDPSCLKPLLLQRWEQMWEHGTKGSSCSPRATGGQGSARVSPALQCRAILLIPAGQPSAFSSLASERSELWDTQSCSSSQTPLALQKSLGPCACSGGSFPLQIPWNEAAWQDMERQHLAEAAAAQIKPVLGYHSLYNRARTQTCRSRPLPRGSVSYIQPLPNGTLQLVLVEALILLKTFGRH